MKGFSWVSLCRVCGPSCTSPLHTLSHPLHFSLPFHFSLPPTTHTQGSRSSGFLFYFPQGLSSTEVISPVALSAYVDPLQHRDQHKHVCATSRRDDATPGVVTWDKEIVYVIPLGPRWWPSWFLLATSDQHASSLPITQKAQIATAPSSPTSESRRLAHSLVLVGRLTASFRRPLKVDDLISPLVAEILRRREAGRSLRRSTTLATGS